MKTGKNEGIARILGLLLACAALCAAQPMSTQAALIIEAIPLTKYDPLDPLLPPIPVNPVLVFEQFRATVWVTNTGLAGTFDITIEQDTLTSMVIEAEDLPRTVPPTTVYPAQPLASGQTDYFRFLVTPDLVGKFRLYGRASPAGVRPWEVTKIEEVIVLLPTTPVSVLSVLPYVPGQKDKPVDVGSITSATVIVANTGPVEGMFDIGLETDIPGPLQVLTPAYLGQVLPPPDPLSAEPIATSYTFQVKVNSFGAGNLYGRARRTGSAVWESSLTAQAGNMDKTPPEVVGVTLSNNPVSVGQTVWVTVSVNNPAGVSGLFDVGLEKDPLLRVGTLPPPQHNEVFAAKQSKNFVFSIRAAGPGTGLLYGKARRAGGSVWQSSESVELTIEGSPGPAVVSVTAEDSTASEMGPDTGTFRISRTGDTTLPLDVYFTMGGMATNGTDYDLISTPATIPAGSSYVDITLMPKGDSIAEGDEVATLIIWDSASYTVGSPSSASIVIREIVVPPPSPAIRELITRFYQQALGRDPEPGAVDAWEQGYYNYALSFNIDVRFIGREMGRLFFLSEEYQARNRADAEFIADCYSAFLGREPSQDELNGWLGGVWNRPEAMAVFAESQEFANLIEGISPGHGGDPTRNFVTTMYIGILDRLVDRGGLEWWANTFNSSRNKRATAENMGRALFSSPEYTGKNASTEDKVVSLYRAFMGRYPGSGEIAYWAGELNSGKRTFAEVLDVFVNSQEFTLILTKYFGSGAASAGGSPSQPAGVADIWVLY